MPTVADHIARRLAEAGCRYAFGIPGGEVLELIRALEAVEIQLVLAKHENAAGFMAEGTHHRTGAPALLVATLGPGVANAVNVVANAQQDRVPMIFLTGCVDPVEAATYTHQVFDHAAVLRPITKASFTVVAGATDSLIDKALALATDDPPGPVHLDVSVELATRAESVERPTRRAGVTRGAPPAGPELEQSRAWLAEAERPLLIAGMEVLHHRAEAELASLARDLGIPVITTYKAKGVLDESDPLALGGAGLSPAADKQLAPVVAGSDLVLLAGYDPIEMRPAWRHPWGSDTRVVEFSATPNTHYMHQASHSFVGDVGAGLRALRRGASRRSRWSPSELERTRAVMRDVLGADADWGPAAIVDQVRRRVPRDAIATVDSGAHRIVLSQIWHCHEPRTLLQSSALCTMGCALPLALGAKLGDPGRPVVCFVGDAGLEMVLGELATARDLGRPIVIVVFVDSSLALIELKQRQIGHERRGVAFGATDLAAVADAMGGRGFDARTREELDAALASAAVGAGGFTLIACRIDQLAYEGRL